MWRQKIAMHTDEYEISLSRELSVCRKTIQRIRKTLQLLEHKHKKTTDAFMRDIAQGTVAESPEFKEDYDAWQSTYESLKKWEALEKQYEELYRALKI
jgi:hypothetical protein